MVLSRQQREELLLNWDISVEDIIDSIRANIKVKNQRRQTVTNLGKAERLEEAIESATRKLKRVLLRKSTGDKVKQLQEQANVAAKALRAMNMTPEEMLDQVAASEASAEMKSQAGGFENRELQVTLTKSGSDSQLGWDESMRSDVDDHNTLMSGLSLGNSTSASVREMEQFYRDLELEMFGDMPLPNMVGETLEVPGLEIPEGERVYHDLSSVFSVEEAPSVAENEEAVSIDANRMRYGAPPMPLHLMTQRNMGANIETVQHEGPYQVDERNGPLGEKDLGTESEPSTPPYPFGPIPAGICLFHDDPVMAMRMGKTVPGQVKLNDPPSVQDQEMIQKHRVNVARAYLSQTVTAMEQRYLHPSLTPPPPRPYPNQHGSNFYGETDTKEPKTSQMHRNVSSSGAQRRRSSKRRDGPEVYHIPPFTTLTPTHWMEGGVDPSMSGELRYEPITITEDDGMRHLPRSIDGGAEPNYVLPQRYPTSFCI